MLFLHSFLLNFIFTRILSLQSPLVMIKQIPNMITSLNLLCGCVAILFAVQGDLITTALFAFLGIFFDFFDGLAARLLDAQTKVGLEMDSLADVITSGVVPGIVMLQLLSQSFSGTYFNTEGLFTATNWNDGFHTFLPVIGLLITVASAYRLAKFNVDTRQTTSFIGLPTPANTLLIASIPLILHYQYTPAIENALLHPAFLLAFTVLSCVLLNAELPLFALKFKTWDFKSNAVRYVFLLLCIVLLVFFHFIAIPVIIGMYILISFFYKPVV